MAKRRRPRRQPVKRQLVSDGALCVTFVNTASEKRQPLATYEDLLAWGVETGVLAGGDASRLERSAGERPASAADVVRRAQTLRGRLERIFLAVAAGDKPAAADFEAFNGDLGAALSARRILPTTAGHRWAWGDRGGEDLDRMLWPILLSAADLLTSRHGRKLRRCPGKDCGLLFVDRSPGKPRKWCSLTCGNRSTSLKHYRAKIRPRRERQKKESEARQRARLAGYGEAWQPPEPEER